MTLLHLWWLNIASVILIQKLDHVKKCEEDLTQMAMNQRPLVGYKNTSKEIYDKPLLDFIQTRNQIGQLGELEVSAEDLERECYVKDTTENIADEDESGSDSEGDESEYESEPKTNPADKKAARKEHKKKVKEEKRESRKNKIPKAEKKRRKKLAKAKCSR